MKSRLTKDFRKQFARLPPTVKKQARTAYQRWKDNPYHKSLQFKQVSPRQPIYSVRVSLGWRALGLVESDVIYWFWIGPHKAYDQLLKRL